MPAPIPARVNSGGFPRFDATNQTYVQCIASVTKALDGTGTKPETIVKICKSQ